MPPKRVRDIKERVNELKIQSPERDLTEAQDMDVRDVFVLDRVALSSKTFADKFGHMTEMELIELYLAMNEHVKNTNYSAVRIGSFTGNTDDKGAEEPRQLDTAGQIGEQYKQMMTREFLSRKGVTTKTVADHLVILKNDEQFDIMTSEGLRDITSKHGGDLMPHGHCLKSIGVNVDLSNHLAMVKKCDVEWNRWRGRGARDSDDHSETKNSISLAWKFSDIFAGAEHMKFGCWLPVKLSVANRDMSHDIDFKKHIAYTLVSLGTRHDGGYLVLSHGGKETVHDWTDGRIHSVVFSAECEAQFLPVSDGEQTILVFSSDSRTRDDLLHPWDPETTKRWRFEHDIVTDNFEDLLPVILTQISEIDEIGIILKGFYGNEVASAGLSKKDLAFYNGVVQLGTHNIRITQVAIHESDGEDDRKVFEISKEFLTGQTKRKRREKDGYKFFLKNEKFTLFSGFYQPYGRNVLWSNEGDADRGDITDRYNWQTAMVIIRKGFVSKKQKISSDSDSDNCSD